MEAVDAATGRRLWSVGTSTEVTSGPIVTGHALLIGSRDGTLLGLDLSTGEERWRWRLPTPTAINGVASAEDVAYLTSGFALAAVALPE